MSTPAARHRPTQQSRAARLLLSLRGWQIAAVLVFVGVGLLWLSAHLAHSGPENAVETTVREVGALLLATGALSVLWDLLGRRALTDDLMAAASLASNINESGLQQVARHYLDADWNGMLASATQVDLFFAYARTWRNAHATALRELVGRGGTRLRVILPDKADDALMGQLAAKYRYPVPTLRSHIEDAESDIENLRRQASPQAMVELKRTCEFPVFTYYRFDRTCIVALYAQAPGRVDVPTLECAQGGSLYAFFRDQFDALWNNPV
jgi:hypothetical protein